MNSQTGIDSQDGCQNTNEPTSVDLNRHTPACSDKSITIMRQTIQRMPFEQLFGHLSEKRIDHLRDHPDFRDSCYSAVWIIHLLAPSIVSSEWPSAPRYVHEYEMACIYRRFSLLKGFSVGAFRQCYEQHVPFTYACASFRHRSLYATTRWMSTSFTRITQESTFLRVFDNRLQRIYSTFYGK
jgi:hypothetical protein